MFTSFSTALSALSAHSTAIDVVGNNLANLNTPGFKSSAVSFYDLVTQSMGAGLGETQVGFGVGRPLTIRQFTQGAIQSSSGPLDAAIQGDGFMVVKDRTGQTLYTRGGNLQVDKAGNLMTATGNQVQGWTEENGVLNTNAAISNITVPVGSVKAPIQTKSLSFDLNLNAAGVQGAATGQFSATIEVYDSIGASHTITVSFAKSATTNAWDYALSIPDADVSTAITPVTGTITFDTNGKLTDPPSTGPMPAISITGLNSGAGQLDLTWNVYNGLTPRLTQFAQPSAISANAQDGSPAAQLTKVGLADGGQILAQYSNGEQVVVGQLAMASIRNPESLIAVGNNNYQLSARSSLPAVGVAGTGGRGTIIGGAVEYSTVDIAKEFTNLIVLQRGYQANSKVITTVDQMSQDTINLKQ
jgi:flagellar hook protein FlgE